MSSRAWHILLRRFANGTCGVLTALQIVDGFLMSHAIECALVVASDANPGHGLSEDFPFSPQERPCCATGRRRLRPRAHSLGQRSR